MKKRDITILVIVIIVAVVCGVTMTFPRKEKNPDDFKVTKEELLSKVNEIEKSDKALIYLDFFDLENKNIVEAYFCEESGFATSYEIFVKCEFEEDEFEKEIKRLNDYHKEVDGNKQSVVLSKSMFLNDACIAIWRDYETEYALFDYDSHVIQYVLTIGASLNSGLIPEQALPVGTEEFEKNVNDGYNLFMFEDGDGGYDYVE